MYKCILYMLIIAKWLVKFKIKKHNDIIKWYHLSVDFWSRFGGRQILQNLTAKHLLNLIVCTAVFMCVQVHYILQEVVMGGMVLETNMNEIVAQVEVQNRMEKSEVSLSGPWKWFSIFHPVGHRLCKHPVFELHFSFHFKPRVIFDRWLRLLSWQLGSVPFTLMLMFWN